MHRILLACACVLAACKDSKPPTRQGSPKAPDPWAVTEDAAPDTPEARKQRIEAAIARVREIQPKLAAVRGLALKQDVPAGYQTTAEFRAFVKKELAAELPPERSQRLSAAALHIGLLKKPVDLAQVTEQAATSQAGAYYDPKTKKFYFVMIPASPMALDVIAAHELTHALQDQHFDLAKYAPPTLEDDALSARRAVAEGDATFTMMLYPAGASPTPQIVALVKPQIAQMAKMTVADYKQMMQSQAALMGELGPEIKASIEAMDALPLVVIVPMIEAYMRGALAIATAWEHGGWAAVNALYRDPPQSTEQILHPETKLFPKREPPVRVTLTKPAGLEEVSDNVMGEQLWNVYFRLWKPELADEAAAGWGGDRYAVLRRPDNRLVALFATTWDTAADAKQFADAYTASLAARFPDAPARPDGGQVVVKTAGKHVFIVDGADDTKLLDDLARTARFD